MCLACVPLHLRALPDGSASIQGAREARVAEGSAKSPADHIRLAEYYESKARKASGKLVSAEKQLKGWSWMESWSKVPNAYLTSKNAVDRYKAQVEDASRYGTNHRKAAESLQMRAAQ